MVSKRAVCSSILVVIGLVLTVLGVLLITLALPTLIDNQVAHEVVLGYDANGNYTETTYKWVHPPYPITMAFQMFDVVNADSFINGATAEVVERGPYVYSEYDLKKDVNFTEDGTKVGYRTNKMYVFNESLSCANCSDQDMITVPNPLLLTFANALKDGNASVTELAAASAALTALFDEHLFVTHTVDELIYNGYDDKLLSAVNNSALKPLLAKFGIVLPEKAAFQYGLNNTDDGYYWVYTGQGESADQLDNLGYITKWNNYTVLPKSWWDTDYARTIKGTDGTIAHPFLTMDTTLYMFIPEICRSVYMSPVQKDVVFDIPVITFTLPPEVWNVTVPENQGFCLTTDGGYFPDLQKNSSGCLPSGLLDISRCTPGNPPVVISSPHFLYAPQQVIDSVHGMKPNKTAHSTWLQLEPHTAAGVYMSRRLQINFKVPHMPGFGDLKKVKSTIFPIFWVNETAVIDQGPGSTHDELTNELLYGLKVGNGVSIAILVLGVVLLLAGLIGVLVILYENHNARTSYDMRKTASVDSLAGSDDHPGQGQDNQAVLPASSQQTRDVVVVE